MILGLNPIDNSSLCFLLQLTLTLEKSVLRVGMVLSITVMLDGTAVVREHAGNNPNHPLLALTFQVLKFEDFLL